MEPAPTWQAELRGYLTQSVADGCAMVTVGKLMGLFGDRIPLHIASRKWALRHAGKPTITFAMPSHMRFYALTQTLHLWGCSFTAKPKTWSTMVRIKTRPCPVCERLYVGQHNVRTCSPVCGVKLKGQPA